MIELPKTKAEALAAGAKWFFTGEPCKKGHLSPRDATEGKCRECRCARAKEQYRKHINWHKEYHARNRDEILAQQRLYYTERIDFHKERARNYRSDPQIRAIRSAQAATWHAENKDRARAYRQKRALDYRAHASNRRARICNNGGTYDRSDVDRLLKLQRHKCAMCKTDLTAAYQVDHIMPIALGGGNAPANLQILCPTCNRRKNRKHPVDFAREMGMLL